jgi:hypothetical protein
MVACVRITRLKRSPQAHVQELETRLALLTERCQGIGRDGQI